MYFNLFYMKKLLFIIIFFISNNAHSQKKENFGNYKSVKKTFCNSYGRWSNKCELKSGLIVSQTSFSRNIQTSIKRNIYDQNNNILYEISSYDINNGYKIDTLLSYTYKYDELNRLIQKRYCFGMIETYSDFEKNYKPKYIKRYNEDNKPLHFFPLNELLEYDSVGNKIKEVKIEMEYPLSKSDTITKISVTTNNYKYDKYNNITEIRRQYSPKRENPIIMMGGFPLYELENFVYKYNKDGFWTRKYWIAGGKKLLIEKRKYEK